MQERASPSGAGTDQLLFLLEADSLAFVEASRSAEQELGYPDTRLRQMSLTDIVAHPPPEELRNLLLSLEEGTEAEVSLGVTLRDSAGRTIPATLLLMRVSSLDASRIAAAVRLESSPADIGDEARLVPDNAAFVAFASRLGHDVNNLLSTVIGSLGLLREDGTGSPEEDTGQLIDDALSAGRECADLVDRLMAAAGKQLLHPRRVAVNDVVDSLVPLLSQTLPDNIDLRVSLEPGLPDVDVDPDRLEAAIINLVVNAREAMPSGGALEIRTGTGEATDPRPALEPDRSYVQVTVSDAGCGIPEDLCGRVLEPLYSTKSGGAGRGLGLSVANGFARQSHGGLSLSSEPGHGTRVTLHFPPAR